MLAYMPLLIATVVHVHHRPAGDAICNDCVRHIQHPAHFNEASTGVHNCLYCHLLSLPRIVAATAFGLIVYRTATRITTPAVMVSASIRRGTPSLRAPPLAIG